MTTVIKEDGEKDANFKEVTELLHRLQIAKGKRYGSSWCKRGEQRSIWPNLDRKFDRFDKLASDVCLGVSDLPPHDSEESMAQTVADLANYCILYMGWIKVNRPKEYDSWKATVEKLVAGQADEQNLQQDASRGDVLNKVESAEPPQRQRYYDKGKPVL